MKSFGFIFLSTCVLMFSAVVPALAGDELDPNDPQQCRNALRKIASFSPEEGDFLSADFEATEAEIELIERLASLDPRVRVDAFLEIDRIKTTGGLYQAYYQLTQLRHPLELIAQLVELEGNLEAYSKLYEQATFRVLRALNLVDPFERSVFAGLLGSLPKDDSHLLRLKPAQEAWVQELFVATKERAWGEAAQLLEQTTLLIQTTDYAPRAYALMDFVMFFYDVARILHPDFAGRFSDNFRQLRELPLSSRAAASEEGDDALIWGYMRDRLSEWKEAIWRESQMMELTEDSARWLLLEEQARYYFEMEHLRASGDFLYLEVFKSALRSLVLEDRVNFEEAEHFVLHPQMLPTREETEFDLHFLELQTEYAGWTVTPLALVPELKRVYEKASRLKNGIPGGYISEELELRFLIREIALIFRGDEELESQMIEQFGHLGAWRMQTYSLERVRRYLRSIEGALNRYKTR